MVVDFNKLKNKTVQVKQTGSAIGCDKRQRGTLKGLGLRKIGGTVELKCTPEIIGMLRKVNHIIEIKELKK